VLNDAGSIVRYIVDVLSARENINTQAGLTRVVKSILEVISYSSNPVQRTSLVNETAYLLNLPPDMLQQELSKIKRTGINVLDEIGVQNAGSTQTGSVPGEELALCEHLVHAEEQGEVIELVRNFLPLRLFSSQTCKNFASAWITAYTTGQNVQDIIREQDDEEGSLQKFAAKIQLSPVKVTGEEFSSIDAVKDLILRIWRRWLLEKRREISRAGDRNTPDQQWAQLTADIKTLNTWNDGVHTIEIYLTREKMQ
jgi:DNA primase